MAWTRAPAPLLREQYPDIRFYSQASPFIEYFATKSRLGNCRKMYIHLRKEAVDIYAYERGRLIFANAFACKETNDRIYYILYIWKQNSAWSKNVTNFTSQANCPTRKSYCPN